MLNSELLEIAIGVVFTFLVASLIATAAREVIEALLKTRAIQLERGMRQLLDDPNGTGITKELYDHPLLFSLFAGNYTPAAQLTTFAFPRAKEEMRSPGGDMQMQTARRIKFFSNLPNYIPSRNFALALLDVVGGGAGAGVFSLQSVEANAMTLPDGRVKQAILVALAEAQGDLDRARTSLEAWFDGTMDRVSGWYKRETQWILMVIGLLLAIALNIDILAVTRNLAANNALRETLIARIDGAYPGLQQADPRNLDLKGRLADLSGLIGWPGLDPQVDAALAARRTELAVQAATRHPELTDAATRGAWVQERLPPRWWQTVLVALPGFPGWLLTALAVSLGAPFWFDVLSKFMVVRSTVKPYQKSPSEGSQDRGGTQSSADRLEPQNLVPGSNAGGAADGSGGAAAGSGLGASYVAAPAYAPSVHIRLAIDAAGLQADSLVLKVDGTALGVPPDGMVEVPLGIGRTHTLAAKASRGGRDVAWSDTIFATLASEGTPMHAVLA